MDANLEDLILSGKFFSTSRSSSPVRTPSPGWHDDELLSGSEDEGNSKVYQHQLPRGDHEHESVGMGPGRTGVKGVIRDRNEAQNTAQAKRAAEMAEMNRQMEKASLGGKTFLEEERERAIERVMMEGPSSKDGAGENKTRAKNKDGRFGHLREIGANSFVDAVEREERNTWVVVHLYEPSVDRCFILDDTLTKLARLYPTTKFLHCRAATLGFAATNPVLAKPASRLSRTISSTIIEDDEEDPYGEAEFDDDDDAPEHDYDEDAVDTDMLPTLLVYHDGQLIHNWVRVDWEAGDAGIEELLVKHRVLPQTFSLEGGGDGSDGSDDDDFY